MNVDHGMRRHRFDEDAVEKGDHRGEWKAIRGRWKAFSAVLVAAATWAMATAGRAETPPRDAAAAEWRVWLEPRYMRAAATEKITGAEKTDIAGGRLREGALEPFLRAGFADLGITWADFAARARENATADLATLQPVYVRNRKKIIEYAELRSARPIVASAVLAPGLRAMFEDTLGPAIYVVVPNRQTAFAFPKLASNYRDYAPLVLREFRQTSYPVSLEVFELGPSGMQAIGTYAEPGKE